MKWLYLGKNCFTCVDDSDWELVNSSIWHITPNGYAKNGFNPPVFIHRKLLGDLKGFEIDHWNGVKTDNRRCNLRHVTSLQNTANSVKTTVSFDNETGLWRARITTPKGRLHLGRFITKQEAIEMYRKRHLEIWGEFSFFYPHKPKIITPTKEEQTQAIDYREFLKHTGYKQRNSASYPKRKDAMIIGLKAHK